MFCARDSSGGREGENSFVTGVTVICYDLYNAPIRNFAMELRSDLQIREVTMGHILSLAQPKPTTMNSCH
jgi:hypothetical protein